MKTIKQYIKELDYSKNAEISKNVIDTTSSAAAKDRQMIDSIELDPSSVLNRGREQPPSHAPPKKAPLQPPRETIRMKSERD